MKRLLGHSGLAAAVFSLVAGFETINSDDSFNLEEFLIEDSPAFLLFAIVIAVASYAVFNLRDARHERNRMAGELAKAIAEGNQWRAAAQVHSAGLSQAIQQQFSEWQLSASERDVAMLMLKGLAHKEIATLRKSSPATVRQQAAAIYEKSGLSNRTELAAFFLEDLFPSDGIPVFEARPLAVSSDIRSVPAAVGHI